MTKFLIRSFLFNLLLLNLTQIAYSVPISRNRNWVFWYYSNNGQNRSCANYCVLTFSVVGGIILLMILCAIWNCYRIKKKYREGTFRTQSFKEFFRQDSFFSKNEPQPQPQPQHGRKSNRSESMSEVLGDERR